MNETNNVNKNELIKHISPHEILGYPHSHDEHILVGICKNDINIANIFYLIENPDIPIGQK